MGEGEGVGDAPRALGSLRTPAALLLLLGLRASATVHRMRLDKMVSLVHIGARPYRSHPRRSLEVDVATRREGRTTCGGAAARRWPRERCPRIRWTRWRRLVRGVSTRRLRAPSSTGASASAALLRGATRPTRAHTSASPTPSQPLLVDVRTSMSMQRISMWRITTTRPS